MSAPRWPIQTYADLSTAHMTRRDAELLDAAALKLGTMETDTRVPLICKYPEGYFLFPQPSYYDEELWREELREAGFSDDFIALYELAGKSGVGLIRLDADGQVAVGLPTHHW